MAGNNESQSKMFDTTELKSLPSELKTKLESHINSLETELDELKSKYELLKVDAGEWICRRKKEGGEGGKV